MVWSRGNRAVPKCQVIARGLGKWVACEGITYVKATVATLEGRNEVDVDRDQGTGQERHNNGHDGHDG